MVKARVEHAAGHINSVDASLMRRLGNSPLLNSLLSHHHHQKIAFNLTENLSLKENKIPHARVLNNYFRQEAQVR